MGLRTATVTMPELGETVSTAGNGVVTPDLVSDGLRLEAETRRVELDGNDVELTTMEFELLRGLMESRGRVMTRDRLIERLRGIDADVFDRSIDMLISRLREKLGDEPRQPRFIRTVRMSGYQFVGAVGK